jgi:hypothetical protein
LLKCLDINFTKLGGIAPADTVRCSERCQWIGEVVFHVTRLGVADIVFIEHIYGVGEYSHGVARQAENNRGRGWQWKWGFPDGTYAAVRPTQIAL